MVGVSLWITEWCSRRKPRALMTLNWYWGRPIQLFIQVIFNWAISPPFLISLSKPAG
jgi:hypothetical protein|tara:strand:+ start:312 stop:482 length:171 start_codon:yes stop_codon:yes gene_type:complete